MEDSTSFAEAYAAARQALAGGDAQAAFGHLRWVLEYPGRLETEQQWAEGLALLAQIGEALAGAEFGAVARVAAQDPDNPQALYDFGYELIEQALPGIAATVLARANALSPGQERILTELVAALEGAGLPAAACWFLRDAPALLESRFFCRYLLAFNTIMTGNLAEARRLLPRLQPPGDENEAFFAGRIVGMLARADALSGVSPLDDTDLRGWHFVLTGAILLHLSPYGLHEGMQGRYAYIQDSDALVLEGLQRLTAVLNTWALNIPRVFLLPDRNSAILAGAAARLLALPADPWPAAGSQAPGLIVAYDLAELPGALLATLSQHRRGQVLWSHATCWTVDQPFTADLTTYLYQYNAAPWSGGLVVDSEDGTVKQGAPADEPVAALAGRILDTPLDGDALADLPALLALAGAARKPTGYDAAAGAFCVAGPRRRQWAGSPVASARFG